MKQDDKDLLGSFLIVLFILWQIVIVFLFFSGDPKGLYWKTKEFEKRISLLEIQVIDNPNLENRFETHWHGRAKKMGLYYNETSFGRLDLFE